MDSGLLTVAAECFIACLALALAVSAHKPLANAIVRWRAAKLPKGPDAERAQEELEGMIFDSGTAERFQLVISILFRPARLQREIHQRQQVRNGKAPRDFTAAIFSRAIMRHPNLLDWVVADITRSSVDERRRQNISEKRTVLFGLAMANPHISQVVLSKGNLA